MTAYPIADYDDAYANAAHIPNVEAVTDRWPVAAEAARAELSAAGRARLDLAYGPGPRHRYDLFLPEGTPAGLVVFIHGGYWKAFDKSRWSHIAHGPLAHGYAVAIPSYTLCPEARIGEIAVEMAAAIAHAAGAVAGPIVITGHSAGGQLTARLVSERSPLLPALLSRVARAVPISGVHDLRPIMRTEMNAVLNIDAAEAERESPVLLEPAPHPGRPVICWVGADERPEFVRQNRILAEVWKGFQVATVCVEEPGKNHFTVVEGLADPGHALTLAVTGSNATSAPERIVA